MNDTNLACERGNDYLNHRRYRADKLFLSIAIVSLFEFWAFRKLGLDYVIYAVNIVFLGSIVIKHFYGFKQVEHKIILLILMQELWINLVTIANGVITPGRVLVSITIVVLVAFICVVDLKLLLDCAWNAFAFMTVVSTGVLLYVKIILGESWELFSYSLKNAMPFWIIPSITIFVLFILKKERRKCSWVFIFLNVGIIMITRGSTAMVSLFVLLFAILVFRKRIPIVLFWIAYVVATGLTIFSYRQDSTIVLLITRLMGKRPDFTSRSDIYEYVISHFKEYCLFGSGRDVVQGLSIEAHNITLQILYYGGVISFLLFVLLMIVISKYVKNSNKQSLNVLFIAIYSFLVCGLMENVYDKVGLWLLIGLLIRMYSENEGYYCEELTCSK